MKLQPKRISLDEPFLSDFPWMGRSISHGWMAFTFLVMEDSHLPTSLHSIRISVRWTQNRHRKQCEMYRPPPQTTTQWTSPIDCYWSSVRDKKTQKKNGSKLKVKRN